MARNLVVSMLVVFGLIVSVMFDSLVDETEAEAAAAADADAVDEQDGVEKFVFVM